MMSDDAMCQKVQIVNRRGLHARAAAKFVRLVEDYPAEVTVEKDEISVSGRSIMGLMMLAAVQGTWLTVCADGEQAHVVLTALVELIKRKFDEDERE